MYMLVKIDMECMYLLVFYINILFNLQILKVFFINVFVDFIYLIEKKVSIINFVVMVIVFFSDQELMVIMMIRIILLEQKVQLQFKELIEKVVQYIQLYYRDRCVYKLFYVMILLYEMQVINIK